jgi:hypothetical protein
LVSASSLLGLNLLALAAKSKTRKRGEYARERGGNMLLGLHSVLLALVVVLVAAFFFAARFSEAQITSSKKALCLSCRGVRLLLAIIMSALLMMAVSAVHAPDTNAVPGDQIFSLGGGGGEENLAPGPGSATGLEVVREAEKYLGVPYVLGGPEACIPGQQMDCTCLTTTVFREFGLELPDHPQALLEYGREVPTGEARAGDIHVYADPGDDTGGHVSIDMGDGRIIHANPWTMDTSIHPSVDYGGEVIATRRLVGD